MFKSEAMQRVRVYGEKTQLNSIVEALYQFGAIHVTPTKTLKEHGEALETFKDISTALINVRTAEKILDIKNKPTELNASLQKLQQMYEEVQVAKILALNEERGKSTAEKTEVEKKLVEIAPFAAFGLEADTTAAKSIALTVFQTTSTTAGIKADFAKVQNCSTAVKATNGAVYCLVAYDKTQTESVAKLIAKHSVKTLAMPEIQSNSFQLEINALGNKLQKISGQISEADRKLGAIKAENNGKIASLRQALETESKKAQLPFHFGATVRLVAVEGWVPAENAASLERELAKTLTNCHVEFITTKELPPTKLKNPRPLNSFEELVKFFSLPKSTELDPTPLVAVSFPLFFGMIVGDIGYGLVALLLALLVKSKTKGDHFMQAFGTMLAVSAVSSIIFGFIFAEFFGFEHILGLVTLHPLIHRLEEHGLAILMALTILFGMIHLAIGYAIGAWQALKHGHAKHGYAKISWLLLEISLALFIAGNLKVPFLHFIEPIAEIITPTISGPAMLLAVIGIAVFEGATSLFEIPGLLSNIFSYLRIMALGVAGVVIALILNKIPESVSFTDAGSIVVSILLLVLYVAGHLAGIALALFESMIQSMRLQYVEFFSKFFEGGGLPYIPLRG